MGSFLRILERVLGWFDKWMENLAIKKDQSRIEGAKSEAKEKLDQKPLESLVGDSGNPTRYQYPGMQSRPGKDRSDTPTE